MVSTHLDCESCGKKVHFEQVTRCPKCNRMVCKWCEYDDHICDDCFFKSLQDEIAKEQLQIELTKLGANRYEEVPEKKF